MNHKQTFTIGLRIPAFWLHILQHQIFITMSLIIDDEHIAIVSQRLHVCHQCVCRQFLWFYPSAEPTLITGIVARYIAIAIIATIVHQ